MIEFVVGENRYEISKFIDNYINSFDGSVEKYDANNIDASVMTDITKGLGLFAHKRLIIIRELSLNKPIWQRLSGWLDSIDEDITIILVEYSPDKRTSAYKFLSKISNIHSFQNLDENNLEAASSWLMNEAKDKGVKLDRQASKKLVSRVGVDQNILMNEIYRLSVFGEITSDVVETYTPQRESEQVFSLLDSAFTGSPIALQKKLTAIKSTNDPYMTFGLISSQILNIMMIKSSNGKSTFQIAKDSGQKEYPIKKLSNIAKRLDTDQLKSIVDELASADISMKSSSDPWFSLGAFLQYINSLK